MACERRDRTGHCTHYQCPYTAETDHGYQCVDLASDGDRVFCEVGDGCLQRCSFSWLETDEELNEQAFKAFEKKYCSNDVEVSRG